MAKKTLDQVLSCNHCEKRTETLMTGLCEACSVKPKCDRCSRVKENVNIKTCFECQFDIAKLTNPSLEFAEWKLAQEKRQAFDKVIDQMTPEQISVLPDIMKKLVK